MRKYTLKSLIGKENAKVTYRDGTFDFFDNIEFGLIDYANGHKKDASVMVYPMYGNGRPREDMTLCYLDQFLDVLNTAGAKVQFDVRPPTATMKGTKTTLKVPSKNFPFKKQQSTRTLKKYTPTNLLKADRATSYHSDGSFTFFDNISFGLYDYFNGHRDDASVIAIEYDKNGEQISEEEICPIWMMITDLNSAKKVIINGKLPANLNARRISIRKTTRKTVRKTRR